jgi:DNA-binding response OmpR family regulator
VLFVEDSLDDVELIRLELGRHGFRVQPRVAETRSEFLSAMKEGTWDIVLSDHSMKGFSSTDALHLLRDHDSDIPFIIVSGTIGEDSAVEAMRAGAHDYVLKHNLRRLGPAVERELREAANRRMQRSTQAALHASEHRLRHAQRMEAVGRLAGGIADDFNNLIGEDAHFSFTHAGPPQLVLIDPGQFEQIVMNLVINARDAMPTGGRLTVFVDRARIDSVHAAELEIAAGTYVTLAVSDTGEGIEPDTLEHIFEPFFTTKAPGSGTGLGLSTVFGIVHQNGGAIEVNSVVKQGTTFRVYFPLSAAPEADREPVAQAPVATDKPSTILLAEDEQGVGAFLEMALTRAGHHVITTQSGDEAVETGATSGTTIDLLITDVVMPGMSGPEVADRLRQSHPHMKTLFLSGHSTHSALPDRVIADPGLFLQKPFTVEALLSRVRERLARGER